MDNAVAWHSRNAELFDGNYARRRTFRERFDVWTDILDRHSHPANRVLDLGCGSGVFSLYAAQRNAQVTGIDGSREMIGLCKLKATDHGLNNVTFVQTDIASVTPEAVGAADLIICSSVLEYVDDLAGAIRTMSRVSAPGGVIAISMPNPVSLYRRLEPVAYRLTGRPKYFGYVKNMIAADALANMLAEFGFDMIETRFFSRTLAIAPFLHWVGMSRLSDNLYVVVARRRSSTKR